MCGSPRIQKTILEPEQLQVRRKPGEVPYPLVRSGSASAFDIWDSMFCWAACHGPSMLQFDKPPSIILDLGCGSGYWAIETAQRWNDSTVYGFDICATQPSRRVLEFIHPHIAGRVKWVHGNFLEPLPFPSSSFDFVRIAHIGLGVPEDEWPSVLKEVARVMKPGAAVEIVEEAPIFPCIQPLPPQKPPEGHPQLTLTIDDDSSMQPLVSPSLGNDSGSAMLTPTESWSSILDERFDMASPTLSSKTFASSLSLSLPLQSSRLSLSPYDSSLLSPSFASDLSVEMEPIGNPRDHSDLKAAWDKMLYRRFLASDPSAVMPLYLTSASFVDTQLRPLAKIHLPPPSQYLDNRSLRSDESSSSSQGSLMTQRGGPDSYSSSMDDSNWSNIHLARTVDTVRACKESIWEEYKRLWNPSTRIISGRTTVDTSRLNEGPAAREAFEEQWDAWENDMMDRIGFRECVTSAFGWQEPSGPDPDWRRWRSLVAKNEAPCPAENLEVDDADICRSICGIVAWKGLDEPSP